MTETNGTAALDVATVRAQLQAIAEDMHNDAIAFDGQPLDGVVIGTAFGNHGAAIARLAEIVQSLLPNEPSVSDERVEEILDILDGFAVHEYEVNSSIVMGRVVHTPEIVGSDFNLDDACDWAREQRDVKSAVVTDAGVGVVVLVDGTELVWERPEKKWALTVSDDATAVRS